MTNLRRSLSVLACLSFMTILLGSQAAPILVYAESSPLFYLRPVWVIINSQPDHRSAQDLQAIYTHCYRDALFYWIMKGVPEGLWQIQSDQTLYFNTLQDWLRFWDSGTTQAGCLYFVETEEHELTWYGRYITYGDSHGQLTTSSWTAFVYTKTWIPDSWFAPAQIWSTPDAWVTNTIKTAISKGLGMPECWLGNFGLVNCLDGWNNFDPAKDSDLCPFCQSAWTQLKHQYGW